jgi:hypothetical protein
MSIKYGFCATFANYFRGHVPGRVYRVPYTTPAYFQHFQTVKLAPNPQPPADPDAQSVKIPYRYCGEFTFRTVKCV